MNLLEIIGLISIVIAAIILIRSIYKSFFPDVYNWDNCPNDHDTMSRSGYNGKCNKCGNNI